NNANRKERQMQEKGKAPGTQSTPPIAAKNPNDDNQCDDGAGEEDEYLKDWRNVHDSERNSRRKSKRQGFRDENKLGLSVEDAFEALLFHLVGFLANDVAGVRVDEGKGVYNVIAGRRRRASGADQFAREHEVRAFQWTEAGIGVGGDDRARTVGFRRAIAGEKSKFARRVLV